MTDEKLKNYIQSQNDRMRAMSDDDLKKLQLKQAMGMRAVDPYANSGRERLMNAYAPERTDHEQPKQKTSFFRYSLALLALFVLPSIMMIFALLYFFTL